MLEGHKRIHINCTNRTVKITIGIRNCFSERQVNRIKSSQETKQYYIIMCDEK